MQETKGGQKRLAIKLNPTNKAKQNNVQTRITGHRRRARVKHDDKHRRWGHKTDKERGKMTDSDTQMNKWNNQTGVHRKRAGKGQRQEVESHNLTHEDKPTKINKETTKPKAQTTDMIGKLYQTSLSGPPCGMMALDHSLRLTFF